MFIEMSRSGWVIIFEYKYHAAIVWKTNWTSAFAKKAVLKVISQD